MRELCDSMAFTSAPGALQERFDADGYLFLRGLIAASPLDELAAAVVRIMDDLDLPDAGPEVLERFKTTRVAFYTDLQKLEVFHAPSHDPRLLQVMRAIVGEDAFVHPQRLFRTVLPNIPELVTPPHQDYAYIRGTEQTVTAWIPVRRCAADQGGLRLLPGSHTRGVLPLVANTALAGSGVVVEDPDAAWATAEYAPGDVLLFHSLTVHGGTANRSANTRLSADYRYQSARQPVADRSLSPPGRPGVPDWPDLLATVPWDHRRWLSVPDGLRVVEFDEPAAAR